MSITKNLILIFLFWLLCSTNFAQSIISGTSYTHFQIKSKKDTIDFVIADTNLTVKKPLLLFCQGSQPVPLFIKTNEQGNIPIPLGNFNLNEINEKYHVCVISMPKTPLIANINQLNNQYCYITDTSRQHSYSEEYQKNDYSENYIGRANKVIKFLLKQDWISSENVIIAGHSQGARIAVGIASSNKNVSKVGLFAYDPNGRIDQRIRQIRKNAENGKISWEEADSLQAEQYNFYKELQDPEFIAEYPRNVAWKSFSKPTINQLIKLKIPVYIAYGSEDIIADFCDLLPFQFIDEGKENYKIKRYGNLEHNFFPVDEDGTINYKEGKWEKVITEFLDWVEDNHVK